MIDAAGAHRGREAAPERGARAPAFCRRALRRGGTVPPPRPGPAAPSQPRRSWPQAKSFLAPAAAMGRKPLIQPLLKVSF